MDIDPRHVDEVLATTRAVRRRLDLERPVDNQLLLDCIDLAEQAPTGGNLGSRRWLIVRDQAVKDQLGELYAQTALPFMSAAAERLRGTGHPQEQVMASAEYLAQHLAEVPAIVIPTIIGRHDGNGRPGLFDSVIQAAWSFCLALRARGLGTTWVTAALEDEARVKEILGIPAHMTEIVLFPVAWTKGTEFRRAPPPSGAGDHLLRPVRHHVRARPRRELALRGRSRGDRRDRHRRRPGRGVAARQRSEGADRVLRRVHRRRVAERRTRGRRGVRRAQPPQGRRRVGAAVHRRRLRRTDRLRLAHVRSRQPRSTVAFRPRTGRRSHPAAVQLRHRSRPVGHDGGDRQPPGQGSTASCAAASTRCRPTCSAPSRGSSSSPKSRDDPARRHRSHAHEPGRRRARPRRRSGSASIRCGCLSSGPPTR